MFHRPQRRVFVLLPIALLLSMGRSFAGEVSRWTLDDTLQDSVGANDGDYAGGAAPSFIAGHDGTAQGALSLNGVAGAAERVALPEGTGLPIRTNARHSVAAWVRGSPGRDQVLYSESNAGDSAIVFQIGFDPSGATGRAHVRLRNGGAAALIDALLSTTQVLDGTWHHVAWVDDNGSGRLYVDGALEGQVDYVRPALALERITIGATSGPLGYCCFLKAAVDDVRVFNHALSAAEVLAMVPSACPAATITDTGPATVLNVGGTEFTITGIGFVQGRHFGYIGDQPLTQQRLTVGTPLSTIVGKSPRLANGSYTPSVRCTDGTIAHAAGRVEAVPPPRPFINAVAPSQVSTRGGETVSVNGVAFTLTMELAIVDAGGATVLALQFPNRNNPNDLTFVTPPHAEGPVDLRATVDGAEPSVMKNALRYVLVRPEIRWAVPSLLPGDGATGVVLDGNNFTPTMELSMLDGVRSIPLSFTPNKPAEFLPENAFRVHFDAPPHGPGFVDLSVRDGADPPFVLPRALEYLPLPRPSINAVGPDRVSTAGGGRVDVAGAGFHPRMKLEIVDAAGATVLPFTWVAGTFVHFVAPPHAAGFVDLRASVEGQEPFVRARALEYVSTGAPEITSFSPAHVDARGGETISVRGRDFTASMQLVIVDADDAGSNYEVIEHELISDAAAAAVVPAREAGPVRVGVRPSEDVAPVFAQSLLHFVDAAAPAPEEIEATLVGGIAEIEWVNPVRYARVHVYRDGRFQGTVEGNVSFYRDTEPVPGGSVEYKLVGEVEGGGAGVALLRVARPVCVPPANVSSGSPGERILNVYGGHPPLAPPQGPELGLPDLPEAIGDPVSGDDGGYKFVVIDPQSGQALLNYDTSPLTTLAPNELVTGFRLLETTGKLRIGVHAARASAADDVSLRVLIEPADPGLIWDAVELTLPKLAVDPERGWVLIDYNTQNPPPPGSPIPDPEDPLPPHQPMPPGAYRLKVYSVGGTPRRAAFEVSSDHSDEQIFVPGVGCPPYPLVRVEPTNNFNPTIHGIHQVPNSVAEIGSFTESDGTVVPILTATIEAEVTDLDDDPIVKYIWDVHNGWQVDHKESASNKFTLFFYGYGTHSATLKVWDNRCGNTTETGIPVTIHPPCIPVAGAPNFSFPSPVPSTLHFVTGLGGLDRFEDELMQTFRVFVVDPQAGVDCVGEAATTHRVQMGLFAAGGPADPGAAGQNNNEVQIREASVQGFDSEKRECLVAEFSSEPPNPQSKATGHDENGRECFYDAALGGRFWVVRFDVKDLPRVNAGVAGAEGVYEVWARGSPNAEGNGPWSLWRRVQTWYRKEINGIEFWTVVPGSQSINVYNPPAALDDAPYAAGSYDPVSRVYDFEASMAPPGSGTGLHESAAVNEAFEDLDFQFPSTQNGLSSVEATVYLTFSKNGHWELDRLRKGYVAYALGKRMRNRVDVAAAELDLLGSGQGEGGGAGNSACDLKAFNDCSFHALIDEGREIPVFKVPILTDPFGGALLSVSFATGVSAFFLVAVGHDVTFDPCPSGGASPFDASFFFDFEGGVGFFAEIDTDVLLGIASLDFGIDFGLTAQVPVIMDVTNFSAPDFGFRLGMNVVAYIEACGLWVFCVEERESLYQGTILEVPEDADVEGIAGRINDLRSSCGSGQGVAAAMGAGAGAQVQLNTPPRQLAIATSPNGFRQVAVGRNDSGRLFYLIKGTLSDWQWPPEDVALPIAQASEYSGPQSDPELVFMNNDKILLAWTQNFSNEDPALAGIQEEDLEDPQVLNAVSRRTEIVFSIGTWSQLPNPEPDKPPIPYVAWSSAQRLSNDQGPNGYRADGKVSLALDPTTVNGPNGPGVWAAWVRYETPDMVQLDGNGEPQVQMRQTSIYARQIFTAFSAPRVKISTNADEIDIEPDVAVAADGTSFIVWVHDPIHETLLEENTGRQILYAAFAGNNAFSAPAPVLADPLAFKGLLEPEVALDAGGHGLLVFTALPANAESGDAGLGSARVLHSVAITGADSAPSFGAPVLIGLQCNTPIYAHAPELHIFHRGLLGGDSGYVLTFQETGSVGSRAGAGNAIAVAYNSRTASWAEPVNLTPDDRVHQGIAATVTPAGEIVLMHQSPFPARPGLALAADRGRGQGVVDGEPEIEPAFGGQLFGDLMGQSFPAVADPAISVCRVSDVYAAAGSDLVATVHVANRGFAPTPESLALTLFHESDGVRDPVARLAVSVLHPGDEAVFEAPLTMPRRPVLFVAVVDGVEGELHPADNERTCALGAQKPQGLSGEAIFERGRPAVVLRWTNGSVYDRVQIYRDGRMLAEVSGTRSRFVDSGTVGIDPLAGRVDRHQYCVRGCIGLSQSVKSEPITVEIPPTPPPGARFIRADSNADAKLNVSDAVFTLVHLFMDGRAPACNAAADANGDRQIDVSDPVYSLAYLFRGGPAPARPFPSCDRDLDPDGLACEAFAGCEGR
jgi:hypothetical protein